MKIKKGDKVIVLAGGDKGKTGVIASVLVKTDQVVIDGVNMKKGVEKVGDKKQLVARPRPIHISNVNIVDPKTGKPSRVGYAITAGTKARIARKSGQTLK